MPHQTKGTILVTALVIVLIMTFIILQIYQTLIMMEQVITTDWHAHQKTERLRKTALKISNLSFWPTSCFAKGHHHNAGCALGKYRYSVVPKFPSQCSIVCTQGQWRDALFYQLWVWEESQHTVYFIRVAKADTQLTCTNPRKKIQTTILSESVQTAKRNI